MENQKNRKFHPFRRSLTSIHHNNTLNTEGINMGKVKKISIGLLLILVLVCASVGNSAPSTVTLKVAHYYAAEHPVHQALVTHFKTVVEKETQQKVKVELYPNNQLGNEQECIEGIQLGTIEMGQPETCGKTPCPNSD